MRHPSAPAALRGKPRSAQAAIGSASAAAAQTPAAIRSNSRTEPAGRTRTTRAALEKAPPRDVARPASAPRHASLRGTATRSHSVAPGTCRNVRRKVQAFRAREDAKRESSVRIPWQVILPVIHCYRQGYNACKRSLPA